ncbi:peptidoglycan-binding protein [Streptomyces sp. NPDC046324]|uniref:peptidoglycan-binding protein n=1 Tax=Streptomyces sp. NPDC046324 TaxID=3154915 RepID=UPI0033F94071
MPDLWLPGAERHPLGDTAPTDTQYAPRVIWHITWDKNASATKPADLVRFDRLVAYFTGAGRSSAPHILWDPFTGRIAQFYPATSRSKSVVDRAGGTRTNRTGRVCLQVETLFFPYCRVNSRTYATVRDTPAKGLDKILAWARSWGVPDGWPMGSPPGPQTGARRCGRPGAGTTGTARRRRTHTDPGPMPKWPAGGAPAPKPGPPRYPGRAAFGPGKSNASILLLGQQLVRRGYGTHYRVGPSRDWGEADRLNVSAFQRAQSWSGADADGLPRPETWRRLFA